MAEKMNPEVKAEWVAALKSGEYEQCKEQLTGNGGFCCLGVLCDLYAKKHGIDEWSTYTLGDQGDETPGKAVALWAGFHVDDDDGGYGVVRSDPEVVISDELQTLSTHNDKGCTFAQIAAAIEEQL